MMNLDSLVDIVLTDALEGHIERCDCQEEHLPTYADIKRSPNIIQPEYIIVNRDGNCLICKNLQTEEKQP